MKLRLTALGAGAALALGSVTVLPALSAAPAYAATCSGYGCDGQDPLASGCNTGAYTVASAPITYQGVTYGTVELRWSPTCQTNWARTTVGNAYLGLMRYANIYRQNPAAQADWHYTGPGNPVYGNMLYSPGCAEAEGEVQNGQGIFAEGWAVQPGCSKF
jgi:hypothetical protein